MATIKPKLDPRFPYAIMKGIPTFNTDGRLITIKWVFERLYLEG